MAAPPISATARLRLLLVLVQLTALAAAPPGLLLPAAAGAGAAMAEEEEALASLASPPLPEEIISEIAFALRSAALLGSSSGATFFIASLILPHIRLLTQQRTTFLIPTDAAIATSPLHLLASAALSPSHLQSLARLHMLPSNLSFSHLLLLPDASLLPTLLGHDYRLRVSPAPSRSLLIGGARIVRPDICPPSISYMVTCHGIDGILNAATASDEATASVDGTTPDGENYGKVPAPSPEGTDSREGLPSATVKDGGLGGAPGPAPAASSATPLTIPALPFTSMIIVFFFFF